MIEFYGVKDVYSESGVDLTLLRQNLDRTIEVRWESNRLFWEKFNLTAAKAGVPKMTPTPFNPTAILQEMLNENVAFVVIGGLAMIAHGSSYLTHDLDVCYARTSANIAALATALGKFQPYKRGVPPGLPFRFDAPTIQAGLNFTLVTTQGDVDFLGEVAGVGAYDHVLAQSVETAIFGLKLRVLSVEGLIAAKKAANRPKDRNHLLELEELKKMRDAKQQP
jgi:predicted nucleotidyltransferase